MRAAVTGQKQPRSGVLTPSCKALLLSLQFAFPASEEAQYPALLCERIISCLIAYCSEQGAREPANMLDQAIQVPSSCDRVTLGALPRGARLKPSVAEFGRYVCVVCNAQHSIELDKTMRALPKGSRIVSRRIIEWGQLQAPADSIFRGRN